MITLQSFIADKSQKLSSFLLEKIEGISYSAVMKILRQKDAKINGKRVSKDLLVEMGDKVDVYYTKTNVTMFEKLYCDQNVLVIDKKSGFESDAVFDKIKEEFPSAGFIHRLDRNTSGIMIFSLNEKAEKELLYGFKNRTFDKKYLATVYGIPKKPKAILKGYLVKDSLSSTVKVFDAPVSGSVEIVTGYEIIKSNVTTSELEVTLFTGKTHQIRAHLSHIGHFIVGDGKYGDNEFNKKFGAKSQMLKAYKLTLNFAEKDFLYYLNGKCFELK